MGVVVGLVGPGPGEVDVPCRCPADDGMVDELPAVIGVQACERERQTVRDRCPGDGHQLVRDSGAEPHVLQLTAGLQLRQPQSHRRREILARGYAGQPPNPDQRRQRVISIGPGPRLPPRLPDRSLTLQRRGQGAAGIGPGPASDSDEIIQNLPLAFFVARAYSPADALVISLRADNDNPWPIHHGPSSTRSRTRFASISKMRHAPHFASTIRESRRGLSPATRKN
ncbi:hypothetical protein SRABI83_03140 [Arthrobacter sp. Bi83]|nr:hypothetical protein SRABI83_03140 [Arthrobacter sp. Bi83]